MNYKLAFKLKKAGFPQYTTCKGDAFYNDDKEIVFEGQIDDCDDYWSKKL